MPLVSSTCRAGPQLYAEEGWGFCLHSSQHFQLCSVLTAYWGMYCICKSLIYTVPVNWLFSHLSVSRFLTNMFYCCSFYARIHWTGFAMWSLSRCGPSFAALHSTRTSSKRHPLNSSSSFGPILTGKPDQWEASQWTALITLTLIKSLVLPQLQLNRLLFWWMWIWAQLRSRHVKFKTKRCFCVLMQKLAANENLYQERGSHHFCC